MLTAMWMNDPCRLWKTGSIADVLLIVLVELEVEQPPVFSPLSQSFWQIPTCSYILMTLPLLYVIEIDTYSVTVFSFHCRLLHAMKFCSPKDQSKCKGNGVQGCTLASVVDQLCT